MRQQIGFFENLRPLSEHTSKIQHQRRRTNFLCVISLVFVSREQSDCRSKTFSVKDFVKLQMNSLPEDVGIFFSVMLVC